LDRKILWEKNSLPKKKTQLFINQNYIVDHSEIKIALNSKIKKIKNKDHLVITNDEGVKREEDFIPAETTYKKMLELMLNKKFESFYTARAKADEKEQQRLKKIKEREDK
jgi:hypothetical protein